MLHSPAAGEQIRDIEEFISGTRYGPKMSTNASDRAQPREPSPVCPCLPLSKAAASFYPILAPIGGYHNIPAQSVR